MSVVLGIVYLLIMLAMGVFVILISSGLYQLAYMLILGYLILGLKRNATMLKSLRNGAYTAYEVEIEDCDIRFLRSHAYYRNNGDLERVLMDSNINRKWETGLLIKTEKYDCLYNPKYIF